MLGRPMNGLRWSKKLYSPGSEAEMDIESIRTKFGAAYGADDETYRTGLDVRFANHIAGRFRGRVVLETCAGGGFTTIALARTAAHVFSVEIDPGRQKEAKRNAAIAGVKEKITFIRADIFDVEIDNLPEPIDAALIDPDWADRESNHIYRFEDSTTSPPSDWLLDYICDYTENITLLQPPFIDQSEFNTALPHELEKLYLAEKHEYYCLYFGRLAKAKGITEFRV
jgi:16S rRNA G966 N2-methylase RsmD